MKALLAIAAISMFGLGSVSRAADQPAPYPLETCLISGKKLGEMGKPVVFNCEGQEIKLCCKDCKKKFDQNPAKHMKDFQDAVKKDGKGFSWPQAAIRLGIITGIAALAGLAAGGYFARAGGIVRHLGFRAPGHFPSKQ